MPSVELLRHDAASGSFTGAMPPIERDGWFLVVLRTAPHAPDSGAGNWTASLQVAKAAGDEPLQSVALVQPLRAGLRGIKVAVAFLRPARAATVRLYGFAVLPRAVRLTLWPLGRAGAVSGVLMQSPRAVVSALRAVSGTPVERLRKAVAIAATRGQQVPQSYLAWCRLFDNWPAERIAALDGTLSGPRDDRQSVAALVFGAPGTAALAATTASLEGQFHPPATVRVTSAGNPCNVASWAEDADCVAVLQAGEVLPRHALAMLLLQADAAGQSPDILYADEDQLQPDGTRSDPLFKPQPSLTLMCSGTLTRGVWLIRRALLPDGVRWAECLRLQAWFRLHQAGNGDAALRVPHVLTHRRADAEAAPAAALAEVVNAYLQLAGIRAVAEGSFPLRLRWQAGDLVRRKVSIVVPSRLKGQTQLSCIAAVLSGTGHPNFDMLVVVMQPGPLDAEQRAAAAALERDPRVRVRPFLRPRFNYSAANNFAVSQVDGELVCLLNDDVSPIEPGWLERMAAVLSDERAGIVGAKLYYPNMTVQHGGAIMGLAGLVEHASRFLPRGEPGYAWRGVLDQEFSCVTGACMLVRRTIYDALGGLDEALPNGFNDVDFCLRARRLGHWVVFAASVELVHHETITFGHHYAAAREQEAADIRLMRGRWADVVRADPFHNPNLSLLGEAEWTLAFPPRVDTEW